MSYTPEMKLVQRRQLKSTLSVNLRSTINRNATVLH